MTDERLHALIDELRALPSETGWVEFKTNYAEPEKTGKLISAISNSARMADRSVGYVVWGIEDVTHNLVGTTFSPQSDKVGNQPLELWFSTMLKPGMSLKFHSTTHPMGERVVVLEVPAAASVMTKFQEIAYIRIGSAVTKLSDHPEREAELVAKLRPFIWERGLAAEFQTVAEVEQRLDIDAYFRLIEAARPDEPSEVIHRLAAERLIVHDVKDRWNIYNLGALLFATDLGAFDSTSRKGVRVTVYDGLGKAKTKRHVEGNRGYAGSFENLIGYIDALLPREEQVVPALRSVRRAYPPIAIRELVANAPVHQDLTMPGVGPMIEIYDDRIEITNPGAPVTDMLRKLFGAPPQSRNEMMGKLMRRMRICEERGSGLVKVISSAEEYHLPAPEFRTIDGHTRVTLFGPRPFSEMNKEQRMLVCYQHTALQFHNRSYMTNATLRDRLQIEEQNKAQVSRVIRDTLNARWIRPQDQERPRAGYLPYWA